MARNVSKERIATRKCDLCADRLSDHRYIANCFRRFLHSLANNLLVSLRQTIADPPRKKRLATTSNKITFPLKPALVVSVVATSTAAAKRIRWVKAMLVHGGCD